MTCPNRVKGTQRFHVYPITINGVGERTREAVEPCGTVLLNGILRYDGKYTKRVRREVRDAVPLRANQIFRLELDDTWTNPFS